MHFIDVAAYCLSLPISYQQGEKQTWCVWLCGDIFHIKF